MKWLYLFSIKVAQFLLPIIAYLGKKEKLKAFVNGRNEILSPLEQVGSRYWFHCASLGEFEQAKPLIEKIKQSNSEIRIVISFFSPSGYLQVKNYSLAEKVFYLPLDTPKNAHKIIQIIKPTHVVFVKYEIWYFHLKKLFIQNIPVYLISATFRNNQFIFSFFGHWLFNLLPQYKTVFLQNIDSYNLLKNKGLKNIILSGDTRFDRVLENSKNVKENTQIAIFKDSHFLLVLGSSWQQEEDILLRFLQSEKSVNFKILIAPHDINVKHIQIIETKFMSYGVSRYTKEVNKENKILILDTIGHLASAYVYADAAFIGGGFTGSLHNILEPLAFGVPVLTGQNFSKFPEAFQAQNEGVLFAINGDDFKDILKELIVKNAIYKKELKAKCKNFIVSNAGATEKVFKIILN